MKETDGNGHFQIDHLQLYPLVTLPPVYLRGENQIYEFFTGKVVFRETEADGIQDAFSLPDL